MLDYGFFSSQQTHRYYISDRDPQPHQVAYEIVRTYSSNPHCDLEAYDGATVVYPSVSEYIGTPGTNIGRTDYSFTDESDALLSASMAGNLVYLSAFYARGHLSVKNEFLNSNGTYQLVRSTGNNYTAFPYTNYNNVGLAVLKQYYNEGPVGINPFTPGTASPDDSNSYLFPYYYIQSDDNYLTSTSVRDYDITNSSNYTTTTTTYKFDNIVHQQVTRTYHTDSKGNTQVTVNKYPADYASGNAVIDSMVNRNMQAVVIEKYDTLKNVFTSVNAVTGGQLNQFGFGSFSGTIVPSKISTLGVGSVLTNFVPSAVSSGTLSSDSRYIPMISFDAYDSQNNIAQYTPRNATTSVILWDYLSENPIAQVKNISSGATSTAYTSFEANGKGNWTFSGTPKSDLTAPTGKMVYPLSSGSITYNYSPLTSYVLSYWSNNGAATVTLNSGTITGNNLSTSGNWTYYEHIVPATAGTITISGSTSIDELRLYPVNAQMITYAYEPEGLMTMADTKGGINHFEYDYFARLKNIKDLYGNIVNNYGYHTYDQTIGNQAYSSSFTRNNCPTGTTPGSLTYAVPANKYYSSTLASANAEASYDLNTNGQAKANQNCGCPITTTSFTLSNSTGINGFQVTFSGISSPYNFPATGSTVIQVPVGTYATIKAGPFGSATHTFSLTGQSTQSNVHYATFTNVAVTSGSNLTLSIQ